MSAQVNIFLLLFGGLQGFLLLIFLIRKRLYRDGYIFLLIYFAAILLQVTLKVMSKGWLMEHWQVLYSSSYFIPLLYGPLAWLFVRQLLLKKQFRYYDLLHFIPFLFLFLYLFTGFPYQANGSWVNYLYRSNTGLPMQLLSLLLYHGLALRDWRRHRRNLKNYYAETLNLQSNWLRQFVIGSFFVCSLVSIALYVLVKLHPVGYPYRYGFLALTAFIYWVSYTALSQPAVFSAIKGKGILDPEKRIPVLKVYRQEKKYSNSGLAAEDIKRIQTATSKLMEEKKPFLDPGITIDQLAQMLACTRHQLSQVLNEAMGHSFYDYVNGYRVAEARQLLANPEKANQKIASLAYDAGFNSLSTFNDVFKKLAGQTPSQYRKQATEESIRKRG